MRFLVILSALLFVASSSSAQCKEYIIGVKGDTLNCVDKKGLKQGRWVVKEESVRGERGYEEEGMYVDGKKEGPWRRFSLEGDLIAVENFKWGYKHGRSYYLNNMGNPIREENWRAVDPQNPYDTVDVYDPNDPTKVIAKQVVKLEGTSLKHGQWKFYDTFSGKLEKTEYWLLDKPARKTGIDDDDLAPIAVTDNEEVTAQTEEKKKPTTKPKEVLDFEKKNAGKKKIKMRDGQTF